MNLLAFGLILICSCAWAEIEIDDNLEFIGESFAKKSKLEDALDGPLRDSIRNGDSGLGIPPLDPFIADKLRIKFDEKEFNTTVDAQLANVRVDGLSSYKINSASFKLFGLKVHMDLTWPSIVGSTNYSLNGNVLGNEVYGTGKMNGTGHDFRFQINLSFRLKGKHLKVKSISSRVSLRALDFRATGLYNDEEKSKSASLSISNTVPKLIDQKQGTIVNYVNRIITQELNEYLSTITLKELLKKLGL
ncbi:uncharacterized protein LOC105839498 [Monomorium pharaonis]|uniref:uncharacterized protein LOC105839498 n=1 Tax=Monomorium pharaonis TaxID=307658 RepID=UPI0017467B01|nr:uncharacterized protein LOC105839498 [Monomorium pharaonis]XP_012541299.2 uncharacterized protein LOC105839498 [Monomorium pharaonis]